MKQYLSNLVSFDGTFDFSNSRFLEPIFISLKGSRNLDSTVESFTLLRTTCVIQKFAWKFKATKAVDEFIFLGQRCPVGNAHYYFISSLDSFDSRIRQRNCYQTVRNIHRLDDTPIQDT